jgi:hypothetical protein
VIRPLGVGGRARAADAARAALKREASASLSISPEACHTLTDVSRRLCAALVAVAVCTSLLLVPASPAKPPPGWSEPPSEYCGTFESNGKYRSSYRILVGAEKVSCRLAIRIQKEYWNGKPSDSVEHGDGTSAGSWRTLRKFPGWKCTSGAGGGACKKGPAVEYYEMPP